MKLTGKIIEKIRRYYNKVWDAMVLLNHPPASMLFVNSVLYNRLEPEDFFLYNVEIMELLDYAFYMYYCEHDYHIYDVRDPNDLKLMLDEYIMESRRDYLYNVITIDDIVSFITYKTNIIKEELSKLLNINVDNLYTFIELSDHSGFYVISAEERRCLILVKR